MSRKRSDEFLETWAALQRCVRSVATRGYAAVGIGATQAKFLRHIARDSRISQADLARATGTDPALTGRVIETLIERGWVRRARSEEDRRQYILELSAKGKRELEKVMHVRAEVAATIASKLDERDLDDFERVAKKLLLALTTASGDDDVRATPGPDVP